MKPANEWTPEEREIYELGHQEGESCRQVDWSHELSETEHELPDELWENGGPTPRQIARYIDKLHSRLSVADNDAKLYGNGFVHVRRTAEGDYTYERLDPRCVTIVVPTPSTERQLWEQKNFVDHYGMQQMVTCVGCGRVAPAGMHACSSGGTAAGGGH